MQVAIEHSRYFFSLTCRAHAQLTHIFFSTTKRLSSGKRFVVLKKICVIYLIATAVTSKISVALAGITGGEPAEPYPNAGGIIRRRVPPDFMPTSPSFQPAMT